MSRALSVSLFGGEIAIDSLDVRTSAAAGSANASGNVSASTLTGLTVLGQLITPSANSVIPLADWGSLELLGSIVETVEKPPRSAQATVTASARETDRRPRWASCRQRDRDRRRLGRCNRRAAGDRSADDP